MYEDIIMVLFRNSKEIPVRITRIMASLIEDFYWLARDKN